MLSGVDLYLAVGCVTSQKSEGLKYTEAKARLCTAYLHYVSFPRALSLEVFQVGLEFCTQV